MSGLLCFNAVTLSSSLCSLAINNTTNVTTFHWSSAHTAGCQRLMLFSVCVSVSVCVVVGGSLHGRRCSSGWYYPGCTGCGGDGGKALCGTGKHTCDPLQAFLHAFCSRLIHTLINRLIFALAALYTRLNAFRCSADKADDVRCWHVPRVGKRGDGAVQDTEKSAQTL